MRLPAFVLLLTSALPAVPAEPPGTRSFDVVASRWKFEPEVLEVDEGDTVVLRMHSSDTARNDAVLRAWDEHLAHRSLPSTLAPLLRTTGFEDVRMEAHAFATAEFDADRYGTAVIPIIGDFAAGRVLLHRREAEIG